MGKNEGGGRLMSSQLLRRGKRSVKREGLSIGKKAAVSYPVNKRRQEGIHKKRPMRKESSQVYFTGKWKSLLRKGGGGEGGVDTADGKRLILPQKRNLKKRGGRAERERSPVIMGLGKKSGGRRGDDFLKRKGGRGGVSPHGGGEGEIVGRKILFI